jgi:hypothetical protein
MLIYARKSKVGKVHWGDAVIIFECAFCFQEAEEPLRVFTQAQVVVKSQD